jgi:hypothetical protein
VTAMRSATAGSASDVRAQTSNDGGAAPDGARHGASLAERGYVRASFGGVPVLVGPELAAQLRAIGQQHPRQ